MAETHRYAVVFWQLILAIVLAVPNLIHLYEYPDDQAASAWLLSVLLFLGIVRLLQRRPVLLAIVTLLAGLLAYIDIIHLIDYGAHLSVGAFGSILDTDPREASEFFLSVSPTTLPLLGIFAITTALLILFFPRGTAPTRSRKVAAITALLIIIPIADYLAKGSSRDAWPLAVLQSGYDYFDEATKLQTLLADRQTHHFNARRATPFREREHYLLILGESARRDHLSLYGYPRNTTPRLSKRHNLLVFTDAVSPANQTRRAVKMLLSPATTEDIEAFYRKGSIIGLAHEAGFGTQWLSNQGRYGEHDTEVSSIGREADYCVFTNTDWDTTSLDENLVEPLQKIIRTSRGSDFTVIHLLGSHAAYDKRYPKAYSVFTGTPPHAHDQATPQHQIINAYDNSLRYSDSIIDTLIAQMARANDIGCAIYVADHGEVLGEDNGRVGHGFPKMQQAEAEVPMMVWCTDKFRQQRPDDWQRLQDNRHQPYSTQHLFDTLADLMQIDFPEKQPRWSILNKDFEPTRTRYLLGADGTPTTYEAFVTTTVAHQ